MDLEILRYFHFIRLYIGCAVLERSEAWIEVRPKYSPLILVLVYVGYIFYDYICNEFECLSLYFLSASRFNGGESVETLGNGIISLATSLGRVYHRGAGTLDGLLFSGGVWHLGCYRSDPSTFGRMALYMIQWFDLKFLIQHSVRLMW